MLLAFGRRMRTQRWTLLVYILNLHNFDSPETSKIIMLRNPDILFIIKYINAFSFSYPSIYVPVDMPYIYMRRIL